MSAYLFSTENHKTTDAPDKRAKIKTSIYLLPNLITSASLFFGLLAIKISIDARILGNMHSYVYCAYAILAAALCDGMDGTVARLTHTQSAFGVQLDSLCDLVSFGVAPAIVLYNNSLNHFPGIGIWIAFIYAACGALRLARFNVQSYVGKSTKHFLGIPIPMAAVALATLLLFENEVLSWTSSNSNAMELGMQHFLMNPNAKGITVTGIMFLLALGMVSTFEYISTKSFKLPQKKPFLFFAVILIVIALLLSIQLVLSLSVIVVLYCLHGPILWLYLKKYNQSEEELFQSGEE